MKLINSLKVTLYIIGFLLFFQDKPAASSQEIFEYLSEEILFKQSLQSYEEGSSPFNTFTVDWLFQEILRQNWLQFTHQLAAAKSLKKEGLQHFIQLLLLVGEIHKAYFLYDLAFTRFPDEPEFIAGYAFLSTLQEHSSIKSQLLWKRFSRLLQNKPHSFHLPPSAWSQEVISFLCYHQGDSASRQDSYAEALKGFCLNFLPQAQISGQAPLVLWE